MRGCPQGHPRRDTRSPRLINKFRWRRDCLEPYTTRRSRRRCGGALRLEQHPQVARDKGAHGWLSMPARQRSRRKSRRIPCATRFAAHMLNHCANLRAVQMLLGHSFLSTTQVYTHVASKHLKELHERHHPAGGDIWQDMFGASSATKTQCGNPTKG